VSALDADPATEAARRSREVKASLGLVVTAFLWGTMVAFTGDLLHVYDPFVIATVRYVIAAPTLLLLAGWLERGNVAAAPVPIGRVLVLGGVGMTGFATCYTYGIRWSDPITAAAILALNPVVSVLMQWLLDGIRTSLRLMPGIALATIGAVMVGIGRPNAAPGDLHGGELLLVAGAVMWAWYSLRAQTWLAGTGMSQLRLSAATTAAGAFWLVVVLGISVGLGDTRLPTEAPSPIAAGQLLWLGVLSTAAAIAIWNAGVAALGVGVASLFANLSPVFAVGMSMALGVQPSLAQIVGGVVVIAGVGWVQLVKLRGG
jgi:drug/metabolite transporter (DMT)-like permease